MGALVISVLMASNTSVCFGPYTSSAFFSVSSQKLSPSPASLGEYLHRCLTIPKKHWRSLTWVGCGIPLMAWFIFLIFRFVSIRSESYAKETISHCLEVQLIKNQLNIVLPCNLQESSQVLSWSLPSASLPQIIMSFSIPVQRSDLVNMVSNLTGMHHLLESSQMVFL